MFVLQIAFTDDPRRLAARPAHREHLGRLKAQGKLVTAGPWADDGGALHVYDVADEAEVHGILARDPYTAVGAYEIVQLREWRPLYS